MNHTDSRTESELRPDIARLLTETRDAYEPPSSSRARVHWAIEQRLAAREKPWFLPRSRALLAALSLGLVTAGATAAILGSWGATSSGSETSGEHGSVVERPEAARSRSSVAPIEPAAPVSSSTDVATRTPSALEPKSNPDGQATSARGVGTPRPDARESLRAELDLLRKVNAAQRSGDAATALRLLETFSAERGPGVLVEERDAARIVALCSLGRTDEGRKRLARFETRFPSSPQLARARSLCTK